MWAFHSTIKMHLLASDASSRLDDQSNAIQDFIHSIARQCADPFDQVLLVHGKDL
jgi:hypothetical protein